MTGSKEPTETGVDTHTGGVVATAEADGGSSAAPDAGRRL
jgi:hypothetical protein